MRSPLENNWSLPALVSGKNPTQSATGGLLPPLIPPDPLDPYSPLSIDQFPPLSATSPSLSHRRSTTPSATSPPPSTTAASSYSPASGLIENTADVIMAEASPTTVPYPQITVQIPNYIIISPKSSSPLLTNSAATPPLFATTTPPATNDTSLSNTSTNPPILPTPLHQLPTCQKKSLVDRIRKVEDKTLSRLAPITIFETGRPRVLIPDDVFEQGEQIHNNFIICYFKGRSPSYNQVQSILNYLWGKGKELEIHLNSLNGTMLVRIHSDYLRQKILEKGIWHVGDSIFHTAQWSSVHVEQPLDMVSIPIWAHLTGVPLDLRH